MGVNLMVLGSLPSFWGLLVFRYVFLDPLVVRDVDPLDTGTKMQEYTKLIK